MNNEEENELVVDDVPETSQEVVSEVETDTSEVVDETQESVQDTQSSEEDIERQIEERVNKLFEEKIETRLIRDRQKQEEKHKKEMQKYKYLETIVNSSLGTTNIDDAISKSTEFYKEQGITIPAYKQESSLTERQEKILAEAEANEIKECGIKEMEDEANRIAQIPLEKRTTREKIVFKALAEELISRRNIKELQTKGYDAKVLNSEDFKKFKSKFAVNEKIVDIYEMYQQINGTAKKQEPRSPGSAKNTASDNEIKELYSPEEVREFTEEDLKNPKLMKAVEYSMRQWRKGSK